ncbi:MarR family transcriptional regulator [Pseudomonas kurunegalensis]|uniref:MarR family transcriptional regulator n=1 Tax=Pseudomonas kurunegalensis TaxID=485880 RepID=UPI00256FD787|nr:MarR family transcriptional regulator [Pseudomonas kurunegalensis]WJD65121.1 MarR family transcriptional regulator [Pseudomonas kurunegalensis]
MSPTDQNLDFRYAEHSLALACLRARDAVVSNFSPILQELNVTEQQWRVMRITFEYEEIPFAELCRLSCIHKVSMARIVSALSDLGWMEKQKSQVDMRAYNVSLTTEGRKVAQRAADATQAIYDDLFERYGRKKAELLLELLKDLEKIRRQPG